MAKSRSIGGIYAELSLRDGKFKAGLKSAGKALSSFATSAATYGAEALAAGVAAATTALVAGTVHTLDQVDALGDLSAQTGVAIGDMMKLQQAYADGGRDADMAGKDIGKMQKALIEAKTGGADPFKDLGLSVTDLLAMNPGQQFNTIGAAIMRIQDPAERTAKAMQIFGKEGMGLTTVFGTLPAAERALGKMPALAQEFAGAMGEANDLLGHLPLKSDQFFTGFTAGIIGELLPQLGKIDDYDFTDIGKNLGDQFAIAFAGLTDGTLFEVAALKGLKAFTNLAGSIGQIFAATINALGDKMASTLDPKQNETLLILKNTALEVLNLGAPQADQDRVFKQHEEEWKALKKNKPATFKESFDKYMAPGPDAMFGELSKTLGDSADTLWNDLKKRVARSQEAAGSMSSPDPIVNPLTDVFKPAPAQIPQPSRDVDEYMRKGILVGGSVHSRKEEVDVLHSIDKTLKSASKDGVLRF